VGEKMAKPKLYSSKISVCCGQCGREEKMALSMHNKWEKNQEKLEGIE